MNVPAKRKRLHLETKIQLFIGLTLVCLMGISYVWIAKRIDGLGKNIMEEKAKSFFSHVISTLKVLTQKENLKEVPLDVIQKNLKELSSKGVFEATLIAGSEKIKTRSAMTKEQGQYVFTLIAPLYEDENESKIALSISFPVDVIQNNLNLFRIILLVILASSLLVAIAIVYYIIRSAVVEPVAHLKDIAERISAGDYTARSHITTGDELEEFSKSFNGMIEYLENLNNNLDIKLNDLGQANLQLYEMNRQQREFMAVMSHELRTPLNSIIGFSEILREQFKGKIDEKQDKFLQNIYTGGKHLLRLINDILDMAKIESGKLELHFDKVSIPKVIENALSMIDSAERKRVPVEIDIEDDFPAIVIDEGRLTQIISNILSNAYKVSPDGQGIRVRARKRRDMVRIEVIDKGPGIPQDQIPYIFEKFRQIDSSRTRNFAGTGLGLSIVKELTSILSSKIYVESEPGKGANFIVDVPINPEKNKG